MRRHTPGPWKVGNWYDGRLAVVVADVSDYSIVAELTAGKRAHESNARLIAAAPDLLEALEEMDQEYGALHDGLSDMLGDGEGIQRLFPHDIPDDYKWLVDTLIKLVGVSERAQVALKKARGG